MRKRLFDIIFLLLIAMCTLGLIGAVGYFFAGRYVAELRETGKPESDALVSVLNVPELTLSRVGFMLTDKKSSFVNFPKEKKPGTIRIGVFGDSFTYGDEVDAVSDYAGFLQALLREYGYPDVEVLNFGTSWHGFGQAHIVWDEVGHLYNLDYALFGPATLFPERDTRFNHSKGLAPYYLHARYVLDGEGLKLVDVIGDTNKQRFDSYYSFIPHATYLRNDRNAPVFLASLMPPGREIENPFYYASATETEEAKEIYRRLVRHLDQDPIQKIIMLYPWISDFETAMPDRVEQNRCLARIDRPIHFPYLEPNDHNSPTGNALLARQYLAILLGEPIETRLVTTYDRASDSVAVDGGKAALSSFTDYSIRLNGIDVGVFASVSPGTSGTEPGDFFARNNVETLVGLKAPGSSILDGIFIAAPQEILPNAPLTLKAGTAVLPVGEMRPISNSLAIMEADLPGLEILDATLGTDRVRLDVSKLSLTGPFQIMVGDKVLLEGSEGPTPGVAVLHAVEGKLATARSTASGDAAAYRGAEAGSVELALWSGNMERSVKLADWRIDRSYTQSPADCPVKTLKGGSDQIIKIVASGDQFDGPPQMRVFLDDELVGEVEVRANNAETAWQSFRLPINKTAKPSKLRMELSNDKTGTNPKEDRNLYIKEISVDGRSFKPEDGQITGYPQSPSVAGQPRAIYNGSLIITLSEASPN